jgi:hypothetical protein
MRLHALALLGLWLAGLAVCGVWLFVGQQTSVMEAGAWVVIALAASGFAAVRDWTTSLSGTLLWNGKSWAWARAGQTGVNGDVAVCMDLQRMMLLKFTGESGRVIWLWVRPAVQGAQWLALRRALFSRRGGAGFDGSGRAGPRELDPSIR